MVEIAPSAQNEYLAESELQKGNQRKICISRKIPAKDLRVQK